MKTPARNTFSQLFCFFLLLVLLTNSTGALASLSNYLYQENTSSKKVTITVKYGENTDQPTNAMPEDAEYPDSESTSEAENTGKEDGKAEVFFPLLPKDMAFEPTYSFVPSIAYAIITQDLRKMSFEIIPPPPKH